jgi:hypothetical protein
MKPLLANIALLIFSFHFALCQDTTFTEKDFDSAKVYYKTKYIPDFIKQKFTNGEYEFRMANSGGHYNSSCTGSGPTKRLLLFVVLKNRYILFYEHGGNGWCTNCKLYEVNNGSVKNSWDIWMGCRELSYDMLKEVLVRHEYYVNKYK